MDGVVAGSVVEAVRAGVETGHLDADPAQMEVARALDALADDLSASHPDGGSFLTRLFGGPGPEAPRGLYVFGDVGRGKTMLMDLFFDLVPVERKRRVHFHAFMGDVHARVHAWRERRKRHEVPGDDPIAPVAEAIAGEARLLCFDEFAVTDIADAMILGRLFTRLFAAGVTVVATSNVDPQDLYAGGLNRALFLPFIDLLGQRMRVMRLDARIDYRMQKLSGSATYVVPADRAALDRAFATLTGLPRGKPATLPLLGREVAVPEAAGGVARFGFADLCEQPLGAADFLAIARAFHTVLVDDVRVIAPGERNLAKRFIVLIDTLYDRHVKLIASADAEPQDLYRAEDGREAFEFARTASRLTEMRSDDYLALPHGQGASPGSGDATGLVDT